ncbi:MAG: choline dehydrogenase [Streptomyces sp.]|jgi:choline dehydrogenase|nr:choline dehydrogenase [Streptomyces sp.]
MTNPQIFDYVVVGAGAAGSVLTEKLSQKPTTSVLVLEAGPDDRNRAIHVPGVFPTLFGTEVDWAYHTEPQAELGGRRVYWPRGRVLGGSTSINAMMWVRGFAADYDEWAELSGPGWSYEALLPYFRSIERVEGNTDPDQGSAGVMSIRNQRSPRSHTGAFLEAAVEVGFDEVTPNTAAPTGFSQTMVTQKNGRRFSAVDGYLKPARSRPNVTIHTGAHATRVVFEGRRASGVEYFRGGERQFAAARREVVLSGGVVSTPQLLMLSGIGDADDLREKGVEVVADSPEVGRNLRDHVSVPITVEAAGDTLVAVRSLSSRINYLVRRSGMLASNSAEAYGFVRSRSDLTLPDIEIVFSPNVMPDPRQPQPARHGVTLNAILLVPESAGTIRLASATALEKPLIDPAYLTDPEGKDKAALLAGLGVIDDLLAAPALKADVGTHILRPEGGERLSSVERAEAAISLHGQTYFHPVGTARMGRDSRSVVDEELRVRGVTGLRVADASVMPTIIRGHTMAPSMVIGAKAADLIQATYR